MTVKIAVYLAVKVFIQIIEFLIIARAFLSWLPIGFNQSPGQNILMKIIHLIHRLTDPILVPIRHLMNRSIFGKGQTTIDFSPIVAFILLEALRIFVGQILLVW